jgi:hypothetical protein
MSSLKTIENKFNLINNRIKYGTDNGILVDTKTLIVDNSNNRVGINTLTPQATLDISGSFIIDTNNIINTSGVRINQSTDTQILTNVNNNISWSYIQEIFDGANMIANQNVTISFLSGYVPPNQGSWGSVLGPNGKIYTTPYLNNSTIMIIDPVTDTWTIRTIPTTVPTRSFCIGGVCASNGKIYMGSISAFTGNSQPAILVNDVWNNNFYNIRINFGSLFGGYTGCCLGPNGKIYFIPRFADNVLVLNPIDESYYFITSPDISSGSGDRKWFSGSLAPNGKIYCAPARATSILVIDTSADTMTASIPSLSGLPTNGTADEGKYYGGCLAPNGNIYFTPQNSVDLSAGSRFIEVNPNTDTYRYVGPTYSGTRKYAGGTVGFDGNIYCGSDNAGDAIRFNPNTYAVSTISTSSRLAGGTLAPNGKIYFYPRQGSGTTILSAVRIVKTGLPQFSDPWMLAPEFNKF